MDHVRGYHEHVQEGVIKEGKEALKKFLSWYSRTSIHGAGNYKEAKAKGDPNKLKMMLPLVKKSRNLVDSPAAQQLHSNCMSERCNHPRGNRQRRRYCTFMRVFIHLTMLETPSGSPAEARSSQSHSKVPHFV